MHGFETGLWLITGVLGQVVMHLTAFMLLSHSTDLYHSG